MRRILLVVALVAVLALAGCVDDPTASDDLSDQGGAGATDEDLDPAGGTDGPDGELEIHHIDAGQADATLLIAPDGETMLVDSGDWRQDGEGVLAYLDAHDVDRIDHLVATHGHADHIGGHAAIIETYETERGGVGAAYDSGTAHTSQTYANYLDAVEAHDVDLFEVRAGDTLPFGDGVDVTVLNPPEGGAGSELHANSVSLSVEFGETTYLTTGDAEHDVESRLVEEWGDEIDADLYHAGHHGSSTSSSEAFLDAVGPSYAVVSSALDSQYGHPHDEVLERFDDRGVEAYWTAVHGDVVFRTDGEELTATTSAEGPTDPLALLDVKHGEESSRLPVSPPTEPLHP